MRTLLLWLFALPLFAQVYVTGGITGSRGLGYATPSPQIGLLADSVHMRASATWAPAHKIETGDGSNLRLGGEVGLSWLKAGATISHQSTSRWSKTALYPTISLSHRGQTVTPRLTAYLPDHLTLNRGRGMSGEIEMRAGRLYARIGATWLRFRQGGEYRNGFSTTTQIGYRLH